MEGEMFGVVLEKRREIQFAASAWAILGICLTLRTSAAWAEPPAAAKPSEKTPVAAPDHDVYSSHGFTVYVEKKISTVLSRVQHQAMRATVADQLKEAVKVFPEDKREVIEQTRIWVDWDHAYSNYAVAFYCPLKTEISGLDRARQGGVVICAIQCLERKSFENLNDRYEHWLVHELAHSYHDRALGFEKENVKQPFKVAKDRGLYGLVDTKL